MLRAVLSDFTPPGLVLKCILNCFIEVTNVRRCFFISARAQNFAQWIHVSFFWVVFTVVAFTSRVCDFAYCMSLCDSDIVGSDVYRIIDQPIRKPTGGAEIDKCDERK